MKAFMEITHINLTNGVTSRDKKREKREFCSTYNSFKPLDRFMGFFQSNQNHIALTLKHVYRPVE